MVFRPAASHSLFVSTVVVTLFLLGMGVLFLVLNYQNRGRGGIHYAFLFTACLMFCMVAGSLCFRIRSYEINSGNLVIKVGFGEKVLPLRDLQSVKVEEKPFAGVRREMGVGGVWSYYGRFSGARFGSFLAYATSTSSGVLLIWPDQKVLVTPQDEERFIQAARPKQ